MNFKTFITYMSDIQSGKGLESVFEHIALDCGYTKDDLLLDEKTIEIADKVGPVFNEFKPLMISFAKNLT